ncbi:MAG: hypothetical protein L3J32_04515 [Rhizobiaceae bacterium]|nr:hypothetical protein [Rhizobiaceae bacterium]
MTRKQYHFRPSENGFYAWDIDRLVKLSADLVPFDIALDEIREVDETYWFSHQDSFATCRAVVEHIKLITEVDMRYPIILCADGGLMDGMHRVAKAMLEGRQTISCLKFDKTPRADFIDVRPDELPY